MTDTFGGTGNFPEGKLNEHDEGELKIGVAFFKGKIVINFGKPIAWIGMPPDQAIEFAMSIIEKTKHAKG